ncbi:MAG: calcium-binding protein [Aestuariivirga sp.]
MTTIINYNTLNIGDGYALGSSEAVTLLPGYYMASSGANGFTAAAFANRLNIHGTVAGNVGVQLGQYNLALGQAGEYLSIGTSGSVTGFIGVEVSGSGNSIFNAGLIEGNDAAISGGFFDSNLPTNAVIANTGIIHGGDSAIRLLSADQASITNSGTITNSTSPVNGSTQFQFGNLLGAIMVGGTGVHVTNSGAITGVSSIENGSLAGGYGVAVEGSGTVVVNSGTITTDSIDTRAAVDLITTAGQTAQLRNTGTIQSGAIAVDCGAGNETIINGGTIVGDIVLGDGTDSYDGRGGTLLGQVRGGLGDDTYIISDAATEILEILGQGIDTVRSTVSYSIASTIEKLILLGSADLLGRGNAASNTVTGNDGDNRLFGFAGGDVISGGNGDDTINGGINRDVMTGGTGIDRFVFSALADSTVALPDQIVDFTHNEDLIDLRTIDAKSATVANDAFTFIGAAAFTSVAGQLRAVVGAVTTITGDTDGNGTADFAIQLNNHAAVTAIDFLL